MRNIVAAIIIFFIMFAFMCFSITYLNRITADIRRTNDSLEQYIKAEKWEKAYKTSTEVTKKWEEQSKVIKLFVNHQEIDNIEMELWKLPQYVKEETKDEALASVHVLKFFLNHISDLEKINIQNIF